MSVLEDLRLAAQCLMANRLRSGLTLLGILSAVGITAWRVAHFVALALLGSPKLALLLLVCYPFWFDVATGNLLVFVLLAAAWAYRGNRLATGIYLALCVLVPRPV